jgi:hypothetical protein
MEMDSEFININEIGLINNDEFLYTNQIEVNEEVDKEKSTLETSALENEKSKEDDQNTIVKKTCLKCGSYKVKKGTNYCYKCRRINPIKYKCDCNKPHYAKGMCRKCYNQMQWRSLPKPKKLCVSCNSKTVKKGGNFCWSCYYVTNNKKPYLCNCDKPYYAKGLCKSCYFTMYHKKKQFQAK